MHDKRCQNTSDVKMHQKNETFILKNRKRILKNLTAIEESPAKEKHLKPRQTKGFTDFEGRTDEVIEGKRSTWHDS